MFQWCEVIMSRRRGERRGYCKRWQATTSPPAGRPGVCLSLQAGYLLIGAGRRQQRRQSVWRRSTTHLSRACQSSSYLRLIGSLNDRRPIIILRGVGAGDFGVVFSPPRPDDRGGDD